MMKRNKRNRCKENNENNKQSNINNNFVSQVKISMTVSAAWCFGWATRAPRTSRFICRNSQLQLVLCGNMMKLSLLLQQVQGATLVFQKHSISHSSLLPMANNDGFHSFRGNDWEIKLQTITTERERAG